MSTTPGTTRPPLSPAAQAVLIRAKDKPWGRYDQEQFVWMLAVSCNTTDEARAYAEAITASVNAYARDRELLAMARDALHRAEQALLTAHAQEATCDKAPEPGCCYRAAPIFGIRDVLAALGTEAA